MFWRGNMLRWMLRSCQDYYQYVLIGKLRQVSIFQEASVNNKSVRQKGECLITDVMYY